MVAPPESAFLSSDVSLNIKLLVQVLHGSMPEMVDVADRPLSYTDALSCRAGVAVSDLYLSCQLHAHGQPLGLPERTCNMPGSRLRWNEWITFRAKYCDLSPDAWVALTLIGSAGPLAARTIGTARLPLFSEAQQLRTGVVTVHEPRSTHHQWGDNAARQRSRRAHRTGCCRLCNLFHSRGRGACRRTSGGAPPQQRGRRHRGGAPAPVARRAQAPVAQASFFQKLSLLYG
jgi:phosphatidylinositol 3-kinase